MYLEIPNTEHGRFAYRAHTPCVIPRNESRWGNNRDGCGRRDTEILERVSEEREYRVEERESFGLWEAYSMIPLTRLRPAVIPHNCNGYPLDPSPASIFPHAQKHLLHPIAIYCNYPNSHNHPMFHTSCIKAQFHESPFIFLSCCFLLHGFLEAFLLFFRFMVATYLHVIDACTFSLCIYVGT
jgi:hypothetical protein